MIECDCKALSKNNFVWKENLAMSFLKKLTKIVFAALAFATVFSVSALGVEYGNLSTGTAVYQIKPYGFFPGREYHICNTEGKKLYTIRHDDMISRYCFFTHGKDGTCLLSVDDSISDSEISSRLYDSSGRKVICTPRRVLTEENRWQISDNRFVEYRIAEDDPKEIRGIITDRNGNRIAKISTDGIPMKIVHSMTFLLTSALIGI